MDVAGISEVESDVPSIEVTEEVDKANVTEFEVAENMVIVEVKRIRWNNWCRHRIGWSWYGVGVCSELELEDSEADLVEEYSEEGSILDLTIASLFREYMPHLLKPAFMLVIEKARSKKSLNYFRIFTLWLQ